MLLRLETNLLAYQSHKKQPKTYRLSSKNMRLVFEYLSALEVVRLT